MSDSAIDSGGVPSARPRLLLLVHSAPGRALAIGLAALVMRLSCYDDLSTTLFVKYPTHAARFLEGGGEATRAFTASPLYLYYWLGVAKLLGGGLDAGRLVQLLAGAVNCALIAALGKLLFDRRVGLVAGLAAALYLPFVVHDGTFVAATWVVLLNLLSILALWWHRQRPGAGLYLGGLALGLSACARPNGLLLAPFFAYWALRPQRDGGAARRGLILSALAFSVTVLGPPALVTWRNWRVEHDFIPVMSDGGIVTYLGNNELCSGFMLTWPRYEDLYFVRPGEVDPTHRIAHEIAERQLGRKLKPSEAGAYFTSLVVQFIRERPLQWGWLVARKLAYTWTGYEAHDVAAAFDAQDALRRRPWFLSFAIVGALGLVGAVWFRHRAGDLLPLYGLLFTYSATGMLFTVVARYRIPMVPALLWLGAGVAVAVVDALRRRRWRQAAPALVAALCLFGLMSYRNYPMRALDAQYRVDRDHLGRAEGSLRKGDFTTARRELEATIAARPTFSTTCRAHGLLAILHEALGEHSLAAEHRRIGQGYARDAADKDLLLPPPELAGDPVHDEWVKAAQALRDGDALRAVRGFGRLCAWVPALAPTRHCLGVALLRAGEREDGLRQLRLARMRSPGCRATHEVLVRATDDSPQALVAEYRDLVKKNPDEPGFAYGLSLAEAKR